jgi:hypothetical protein
MFKRIVFSLILGFFGSLLILEQDPDIKNALGKYCIDMFESAMHCHMKCTIDKLDLIRQTIELKNVDVSPREQDPNAWHWTCKRYQIKISLLAFLVRKLISMDMVLEDISALSRLENNELAIMPHLRLLISFTDVAALELKTLKLLRVHLAAEDYTQGHRIDIGFNSDTVLIGSQLNTRFYWNHGMIRFANRTLVDELKGTIRCDIQTSNFDPKESIKFQIDCGCTVPQLQDKAARCFINAEYEHGSLTAHIKNGDDTLVAGPLKVKFTQEGLVAGCVVRLPIDYIWMLALNSNKGIVPQGNFMLRFQGVYNQSGLSLKGACGLKNLCYGQTKLASLLACSFSRMQDIWQGHIQWEREGLAVDGNWNWEQGKGKGALELGNRTQFDVTKNGFIIEPNACTIKACIDDNCHINGDYKTVISHAKSDAQDTVAGMFKVDTNGISITGTYNKYVYLFSGAYNPTIRLTKLELKNEQNESLCEIHGCDGAHFACKGSAELAVVKPFIKKLTNIDIPGEGTIRLYGMVSNGTLLVKTKLEHGTIRIPQTYMCITGFDSLVCIDPIERALTVRYAKIQLYEGSVICRQAKAIFDNTGKITYVQVPLLINNCLFNVRKDLFGVLAGNLLITKPSGLAPHINGTLMIDRAQLTETLFSGVLHDVASQGKAGLQAENVVNATCDIELMTYSPIRVNTVFLDADARMNMHIKGPVLDPTIAGMVSFVSGRLNFPYKPLNITKATIQLSPGALTDPLIEIVAKNRIKKYMVGLQVAGSLQNNQIVLSSTPPLSNEQILGLLLVGSEEESLGNMMPAIVMQNIKPLIFGAGKSKFMEKYFNILLKPLQYIHFVPSFGDQTGRGGLRGKLEIDLNDRWRAMIQNNFNLSEDTRFEIEYMLSDDISLKAGRDEHRDVTGEIEMRWKFK